VRFEISQGCCEWGARHATLRARRFLAGGGREREHSSTSRNGVAAAPVAIPPDQPAPFRVCGPPPSRRFVVATYPRPFMREGHPFKCRIPRPGVLGSWSCLVGGVDHAVGHGSSSCGISSARCGSTARWRCAPDLSAPAALPDAPAGDTGSGARSTGSRSSSGWGAGKPSTACGSRVSAGCCRAQPR
jgi:hypothetical protein